MYLIYSNNLDSKEIIPRAKYSTRKASRINLLKEAQQWLLNYKTSDGNWELISHKFETKGKSARYFIKRSDKNEDILTVYEKKEILKEGYISYFNSVEYTIEKIIVFSIMEIPSDDHTIEPTSYIVPTVNKKEDDPKLQESLKQKRAMIKEIAVKLAERRLRIE